MQLTQITDHIRCFPVSYKDIFVEIYILQTESGTVLFDTAACAEDVDGYIAPALMQLGVTPTHIFISHNHGDHAGGLARAKELFPDAVILSRSQKLREAYPDIHCPEDGEILLGCLQTVTIPGHTPDSAALLDLRTHTLVTGDCLQSMGIYGSGYWYGAIGLPAEHAAAIEKLRTLPIENIATAHDYHPDGIYSFGAESSGKRLDHSIGALRRLQEIIAANPELDDAQIAALCNDGTLPKVAARIIGAVRLATEEGRF